MLAVNPAVGHPMRARMRRAIPASGYPHISVAVPVVVARDPNITRMGRWSIVLNNGGRRTNVNVHLREGCRRRQTKCKQSGHDNFFHVQSTPPGGFQTTRTRACVPGLLIGTRSRGKSCGPKNRRSSTANAKRARPWISLEWLRLPPGLSFLWKKMPKLLGQPAPPKMLF
jgi:hypothetical protein